MGFLIAIAILRVDTADTKILAISKLDFGTMDVIHILNLHFVMVIQQDKKKTVENMTFGRLEKKINSVIVPFPCRL